MVNKYNIIEEIFNELNPDIQKKLRECQLIVLDFDGVLTDNKVIHSQDGKESVIRSRADSQGIDLLFDAGLYDKANYQDNTREIDIVILSRETNPIVATVAKKIKVKCTKSRYKKFKALQEEVKNRGLDFSKVLFVGNDFNDIECIRAAGIGVAVADAYSQVLDMADYVTHRGGGNGAIREICELLLYAKRKHPLYS